MSLVEFMMASSIGLVVMAMVMSLVSYTSRAFAAQANYIELDQKGRNALDVISTQLRQVNYLGSWSSNQITLVRGGTNISYVYDPAAKTLSQVIGNSTKVLLTGCDRCSFAIYSRNTIGSTFDQFPTSTSSNTCKLVQMNWSCSRTILGASVNTESVQSAKVVIRNEH